MTQAFLNAGHDVRAVLRPAAEAPGLPGWERVEVFRADLRVHRGLADAFQGVDALVHLAACVVGDEQTHMESTVVGTERLLGAMLQSQTKRIVLASSFSVYRWRTIRGTLDENSPIEDRVYERGGYAIAKFWQERVARRMSEANGWDLTVLRPGVIWGPGNLDLFFASQRIGPARLVIGPWRRLPLTYVENCADAFLRATEDPRARGQTFNIVDDGSVTAWHHAGECLRENPARGFRVGVPYQICMLTAQFAGLCSRTLFNGKGKLPSLLTPSQLAVFKPLRFSNRKLREELDWRPPHSYQESLVRSRNGGQDHVA